jgi:hypothetical protein
VTLHSPDGELLVVLTNSSADLDFPSPSALPRGWAIQDSPRFHVPSWGATPVPSDAKVPPALVNTSGYDTRNNAPDFYLFAVAQYENHRPNDDANTTNSISTTNNYDGVGSSRQRGGSWFHGEGSSDSYAAFRREFLLLTGPTPLIPDYAFGTWFTWWHNYTQAEAEGEIDQWAKNSLPLDIWGMDMNWRDNCSLAPKPGGGCVTHSMFAPPCLGHVNRYHALHFSLKSNDCMSIRCHFVPLRELVPV